MRRAFHLGLIAITLCILSERASLLSPTRAEDPPTESAPQPDDKTAQGLAVFQEKVRLTLAHNCVSCHGGDAKESEFDLTTRDALLVGGEGGKVVVPGDASASRLVKLITHEMEPKMPEEADKLADSEIAAITEWINLGAPYDKPLVTAEDDIHWTERKVDDDARRFWSFQPLQAATPPPVKQTDWPRTPIDPFILSKLEAAGLAPNLPADKRTLIRRAYFDLIGMPPTPDEVQAFLQNDSPDAWPELIDDLLSREEYGERWGRHWLDIARFAESHGFEQDYDRPHAYHFRDFVIKALNQDMPFDRFVRWQIAGDEFAPDDPLAMMATGFLGAGVFPTQITANEVERTRYDALDDMAATTGVAFLGLTVGCARCHDHKFDPIPQADYYRMISTFTTTVRSNVPLALNTAEYEEKKKAFDLAHAPLAAELAAFEKTLLPARFADWEAKRNATEPPSPAWETLDVVETRSAGGATFKKLADKSLLVGGPSAPFDTYTLVAQTPTTGVTAIRIETLADKSMQRGGPGRAGNGNFALSDFAVTASPASGEGKAAPVVFTRAKATYDRKGYESSKAIDADKKSCWALDPHFGEDHAAVFETQADIGFPGGTVLTFELHFNGNTYHNIGRPRLSVTTAPRPVEIKPSGPPAEVIAALASPKAQRSDPQRQTLLHWYRQRDPEWSKLNAKVQASLATAPKPQSTTVMVTSEGVKPIRHHTQGADFFDKTYFLRRGDTEHKESVAEAGFLQVLMPAGADPQQWRETPPPGVKTSYRRRALANWITDAEQGAGQLMARVAANRLWQHHFGRGIVATSNDFGAQGARPTHPELLDGLARRLIDEGYRLKPLHKLLMTSAVYMQSSDFDEAKSTADIENSLWWRQSFRRLEAEAIRDSMLAVSGVLDRRQFGPGTLDEGHNRRSIYFQIKRSRLIPVLQLFDSPEPLASMGRRPSTTIAPQALLFMNNTHVRRWVGAFAGRLKAAADKSPAAAVRQAYWIALSREPTAGELAANEAFLTQQTAAYQAAKKPNAQHRALVDFCQVVLSLNEFIYVE
jgi:mono/diheme cytochrome c family protein